VCEGERDAVVDEHRLHRHLDGALAVEASVPLVELAQFGTTQVPPCGV